jgi:asparagine synthase (glutamine-hydrolysing)
MTGFVALRWPVTDAPAEAVVTRLRTTLLCARWILRIDHPGWLVADDGKSPENMARLCDNEQTIIVGAVFDRAATDAGRVAPGALPQAKERFPDACSTLITSGWGAYVAIRADIASPDRLQIFRDPIGMLDCATWCCGGLRLVSSMPDLFVGQAPPGDLAIDWARIRELLILPGSVGEASALRNVFAIPPGTLCTLDRGRRYDEPLWSPRQYCEPRPATRDAADALRRVTDASIAAWGSTTLQAVAELSGGLDSAIVAAGVREHAPSAVRAWFHYSTLDRQGDERRHARSIAGHLKLPVTECIRAESALTRDDLEAIPIGWRPGLGSTSLFHDRDLAKRAEGLNADTLLTGHGGDAVFFQPPTHLIAADLAHDPRGWRARLGTALDIAAWTQTSVWSVLGVATKEGIGRQNILAVPIAPPSFLADGAVPKSYPSPWLTDLRQLPPAKQMQIWALANSRSAFGTSWCSERMAVIHPLMSQPLIEHVLAIPALELTQGRRDRALVREAYAHRLPADLLRRRSKGALTFHFGRVLAASSDALRSWLLDGVLAAEGVIDRRKLEPLLQAEQFMQSGGYGAIITAVLVERWARAWQDRVPAKPRR